jgi:hypothetical protein
MNHEFVWRLGALYDVLMYLGCGTYASTLAEWNEETDLPTEAGFAEARLHRVKGFYAPPTDPDQALTFLKQRLADGWIVATSMTIPETFNDYGDGSGWGFDNSVYYDVGVYAGSGHALTFIGYDDNRTFNANGTEKKGAFLLVNSWGMYLARSRNTGLYVGRL